MGGGAVVKVLGFALAAVGLLGITLARTLDNDSRSYSVDEWPGPRWHMFSESSPWVAPIDKSQIAVGSRTMIAKMVGEGPPASWDPATRAKWGVPLYFARDTDPVYTLILTETKYDFEREIDGAKLHLPAGAEPAGGSDRAMNVFDQPSGIVYHLTRVDIDDDTNTITAWRSHRLRYQGVGFHSAEEPPTGNGVIRPEELAAGYVNHTMMLEVRHLSGRPVAPYTESVTQGKAADEAKSDPGRLSIGNVVFLDMTHDEVDGLGRQKWESAILHGLIDHGAVVTHNGGAPWALVFESPLDRISLGRPDPYPAAGLPSTLDYSQALDSVGGWGAKLKVLAPFPRPCNDTEPGCGPTSPSPG